MKNIIVYFILACFIAVSPSCSLLQKGEKKKKASLAKELTEEARLANLSLFLDANKEKILGNLDKAAALFSQCIKNNPADHAAMYELASIYVRQQHYNNAILLIKEAIKLDPENNWYQLLYADILLQVKEYEKAADVMEKLIEKNPDNIEYKYNRAMALIYAGKYNDAIKIYDQVEKTIGVTEEISLQKHRIYLIQDQFQKAIDELQKLSTHFPYEVKYYGIIAEIYMENEMPEKALEMYNKILRIEPDNAYVHLSLSEYYRNEGQQDEAFNEMKQAFENPNLDIDTKVKILLNYYNINNKQYNTEAYKLLDVLEQIHSSDPKTFSIYGDFLYRDNKFEEARKYYYKVLEIDSSRYLVWENLLIIESELRNYNKLADESKHAMSLFPEQPIPYFFNGTANYIQKNYETAIDVLNKGLGLVVDNDALKVQFNTYLGDANNNLKKYEASDKAYRAVLMLDSNNIYVLNNYSYYLSLRNEFLNEAENMAKKVNKLVPNNPSYQDTYGWVLYKLGRLEDSKIWLQRAIINGGAKNAVILEHYGDLLYKLGETDEAVKYWEQAKETGTGSEFLEKKISDKKLYE